jgi:hypothetical protein
VYTKKTVVLIRVFAIAILSITLLIALTPEAGHAQTTRQIPLNVHDTKMAPFRALAQLTFQSWQDKDYATSATLAKLLNTFWDATAGDTTEGSKTPMSPEVYKKIDSAMDSFITPIILYGQDLTHHRPANLPDGSKIEVGYKQYLETLKLGD